MSKKLLVSLQWLNGDKVEHIAEFSLDKKHKDMFLKLSEKMFELDDAK